MDNIIIKNTEIPTKNTHRIFEGKYILHL